MSYGTFAYGTALYGGTGTATPVAPTTPVELGALVTFQTPRVQDEPPFLPDSPMRQVGLMRHYENRIRGVNVWERSDGSFCVDTGCNYESAMTSPAAFLTDDPCGPDETETGFPALTDTAINYPWDPFPGAGNSEVPGAYAWVVNWDQTTQLFVNNPYLATWFQGGAIIEITQEQALVLTAAGFGDCIS